MDPQEVTIGPYMQVPYWIYKMLRVWFIQNSLKMYMSRDSANQNGNFVLFNENSFKTG